MPLKLNFTPSFDFSARLLLACFNHCLAHLTQCESVLEHFKTNDNHSYIAAGVERTEEKISSGLACDLNEPAVMVERIRHSRLVILMTLTASQTC